MTTAVNRLLGPQCLLTVFSLAGALPLLGSPHADVRSRSTQQQQSRQTRSSLGILDAEEFLQTYGYTDKLPPGSAAQMDPESRTYAIMHYQRTSGLRQTGLLDEATLRQMAQPRCGAADTTPRVGTSPLGTPLGYTFKAKWTKTKLTWNIKRYSMDIGRGQQRTALTQAFKLWSDVTPLIFSEVTDSASADIVIEFTWGDHGCGTAFEGPGMVVAHAFYPTNGQIHFDEDETWTTGTDEGTNLLMTATHEIGHAIGLGHSEVKGVIMAPYYLGYEDNLQLRDDDVEGIQYLYGILKPSVELPPDEEEHGAIPSKTCTSNYDATYETDFFRVHVLRHNYLWRLTLDGDVEEARASASGRYPSLPQRISAAVETSSGDTYFFKGREVWQYKPTNAYRHRPDNLDEPKSLQQSRTIQTVNYPDDPEAAIAGRDGRIYLIKEGKFYGFDENAMDIYDDTRLQGETSQLWAELPVSIDAAMEYNNHYYFFKDALYWKYDSNYQLLAGYPRTRDEPWMLPYCDGAAHAQYKLAVVSTLLYVITHCIL